MWLNLRTGVVAGLNTTQSAGTVYTFNSSLNGQVAKGLVRADSTVYSTVRLSLHVLCCLCLLWHMFVSTAVACGQIPTPVSCPQVVVTVQYHAHLQPAV